MGRRRMSDVRGVFRSICRCSREWLEWLVLAQRLDGSGQLCIGFAADPHTLDEPLEFVIVHIAPFVTRTSIKRHGHVSHPCERQTTSSASCRGPRQKRVACIRVAPLSGHDASPRRSQAKICRAAAVARISSGNECRRSSWLRDGYATRRSCNRTRSSYHWGPSDGPRAAVVHGHCGRHRLVLHKQSGQMRLRRLDR